MLCLPEDQMHKWHEYQHVNCIIHQPDVPQRLLQHVVVEQKGRDQVDYAVHQYRVECEPMDGFYVGRYGVPGVAEGGVACQAALSGCTSVETS